MKKYKNFMKLHLDELTKEVLTVLTVLTIAIVVIFILTIIGVGVAISPPALHHVLVVIFNIISYILVGIFLFGLASVACYVLYDVFKNTLAYFKNK